MQTVILVRDREAAIAEAIIKAIARFVEVQPGRAQAIECTWQSIEAALMRSELTPRQRELVRYDLLRLRRAQIARLMGVTPATLTSYWKAIYTRYELRGSDARALLHQRLFPDINVGEFV